MQKQDTTKQRRKPVHLRSCDLQTVYTIYNALDRKPDGSHNDQFIIDLPKRIAQQIRALVCRLREIAGTPAGSPTWRADFETAIREVRRGELQRGEDPAEAYKIADQIAALLKRHGKERGARQDGQPTTPAPAQVQSRSADVDDGELEPFGILRGDTLTLELIDGDPREGELIALRDRRTGKWGGVGRYFGTKGDNNPEEFNARYYPVYWADGGELAVEKDDYAAYRVAGYFRPLEPVPHEEVDTAPADTETRDDKFEDLRRRLKWLNEKDDITDCSARFKLEKQIFDLEHPVDSDDWSTWEEGE